MVMHPRIMHIQAPLVISYPDGRYEIHGNGSVACMACPWRRELRSYETMGEIASRFTMHTCLEKEHCGQE